ncbi:MAG: outer membrane protein assembly factor BamE (lipoprotein component of BamABCDE complex) [Verrucomicrobiales bacterium]|jgi:outer membrane protein assembly factor BamE (lipoprotein component of BamABCDE complex)
MFLMKYLFVVGRVLLLMAIVLVAWAFTGHAVSISKLASVEKGMSNVQVKAVLGRPSFERIGKGTVTWGYSSNMPLKWCSVEVYFDNAGFVQSVFHDH